MLTPDAFAMPKCAFWSTVTIYVAALLAVLEPPPAMGATASVWSAADPTVGADRRVLYRFEGDAVLIRCVLSPSEPRLSDRIVLTVEAILEDAGGRAELGGPVPVSGPVDGIEVERFVTLEPSGQRRDAFVLSCTPTDVGRVEVGPLRVILQNWQRPDQSRTLEIATLSFEVGSLLPEDATTAAAAGSVGLFRPPPPVREYVAAGALVTLVAFGLGLYLVLRHRLWSRPAAPTAFDDRAVAFLDACRRLEDDETRREATIVALEQVLHWLRETLGLNDAVSGPELLAYVKNSPVLPPSVVGSLCQVIPELERLKYVRSPVISRAEAEHLIRLAVHAANDLYTDRMLSTSEAIGRRLSVSRASPGTSRGDGGR